MELNGEDIKTIRQTTTTDLLSSGQVYFKDQARIAAITATLIAPVLFNFFEPSIQGPMPLNPRFESVYFSGTTELDGLQSNSTILRDDLVTMSELTTRLFPSPVELSGERASKHRSAISSFFRKS